MIKKEQGKRYGFSKVQCFGIFGAVLMMWVMILCGNTSAKAQQMETWVWPVQGVVKSNISQKFSQYHTAIDIAMPKGTAVYATKSGTVTFVINDCEHEKVKAGVCQHQGHTNGGNTVSINHGDGTYSVYCHMIKGTITVKVGDKVEVGQQIGQVGQSGQSTGYHLHFGVQRGGKSYWDEKGTRVDPLSLEYVSRDNINYQIGDYPSIQLHVPYYPQKRTDVDDCAISATAMIEGYARGCNKIHYTEMYDLVYEANGNQALVKDMFKWSRYEEITYSLGRSINLNTDLALIYSCLKNGNPVLIHREGGADHWSVIVGYNGSTTNLELSGFVVWNTMSGVKELNYDEVLPVSANKTAKRGIDLQTWVNTSSTKTITNAKVRYMGIAGTPKMLSLDLNGILDGNVVGDISGYGTVDVWINEDGQWVKKAEDCADYNTKWPEGTKYRIDDIKISNGKEYNGVYDGALEGIITGDNDVCVYLDFSSKIVSWKVTFRVANGFWNDGTTVDKTVTLTGYEGDTLKLTSGQIPAVGGKPGDNHKAGSWNVTPSTGTAITADTTYVYTYQIVEGPATLSGTVSITGTMKYGQTLSASVSGSNNSGTLKYQWRRGSSNISGATSSTYKLTQTDIGQSISCVVNSSVETGSLTGSASGVVAKADGPAVPAGLSGTAASVKGASDGKITGVTTAMEYSTSSAFSSKTACTGTTITGLKAGTYYVRIAETATTKAGVAVKVVVADGAAENTEGKIRDFVTRMYEECLSRDPDASGLEGWSGQLANGNMNGAQIAEAFVFSGELLSKNLTNGDFVETLYVAMMGRPSDAVGKAGWVEQLENGNMSRSEVTKCFVESTEFSGICAEYGIVRGSYDASVAPIEKFVERLYKLCLERNADQAGLYGWVGNLKNGNMNGARMANSFFFSDEFVNKNVSNEKYVELLYNTLMGRPADEAGKAGWVSQLQGGHMDRRAVMKAFIESAEFTGICANYGIVRGTL